VVYLATLAISPALGYTVAAAGRAVEARKPATNESEPTARQAAPERYQGAMFWFRWNRLPGS
jgi:hypothetical protein